ncbi:ABC transporter permease [Mucilaginibacter pocheonensis]|uniref:ABC transport system permease protein n=1 Tax=Mucilaginibacter pocheonensis TaxID=398050 RepID=A0ABU1TCA7_9SPHI|nr:FtsX-like permease family protein [Mucilaginibacter pocheonensis]MDR6943007.1 putative ABC transport system permease protein [Mucilaginibacter pocheonensis]
MMNIYLKIAWRSITKRTFYNVLNIFGLALAIVCCTLIYLYNNYQLSFDTYHKNANNIFRVVYELHLEKTEYDKGSSFALYDALRTNNLKIKQVAFSINNQSFLVNVDGSLDKRFKEEKNVAFTNTEWFNLFSYHWLSGGPSQLNEPNTVAVTQKQADKYFGTADAVGRTIAINGQHLAVVGVIADSPYNTDLKSDLYLSLPSLKTLLPKVEPGFFKDWGYLNSTNSTFVSLVKPAQKQTVELELARLTKQHLGDGAKYYSFKLLPLKNAHFDARYGGKIQKSLLLALGIIGLLILAIASINYINIMIAGQARRSVEIGTRKVLGGSTWQLFMQFITESLLIGLIAVIIAGGVVLLFMPAINNLLFDAEPVHILSFKELFLFLLIMLLIITTGTGVYPAMVLSRVKVFNALKNNLWNTKAGVSRKVLVVIQNVMAQTLITCTIIIVMQVDFLKNTDKGFDRKAVIIVPVGNITASQKEQLRNTLRTMPGVQSFSFCNNPPSSDSQRGSTVKFSDREWEKWPVRFAIGDSAYARTFGLQLVAGRNARTNNAMPEYLINEGMAKMLHVKSVNDILGKTLLPGDVKGVIVGIVKDFNVRSLIEPIEPSVILEQKEIQTNVAIKLSGAHTENTLSNLRSSYARILPDQVFSYKFIDEEIARLYKTQNLQQKLILSAAVVAIIISSMGLLGLISLITIQRTKEIGIRKVLGASITDITTMLSREFLVLVSVSFVVASPIAWTAMHYWLNGFAYRITIQWWIFALSGVSAVLIALITVSFQSVKAALGNPVESLRS